MINVHAGRIAYVPTPNGWTCRAEVVDECRRLRAKFGKDKMVVYHIYDVVKKYYRGREEREILRDADRLVSEIFEGCDS